MHCKTAIATLCILGGMACTDGELDGPKRVEFDAVDRMVVDVEQGDVSIFGSASVEGAVVERWATHRADFQVLDERHTGRQLFVDSRCLVQNSCRVRYDMAIERTTDVEASVEDGELRLFRIAGEVGLSVGTGSLKGRNLSPSIADIHIEEGIADMGFVESPQNLRIDLGDQAAAKVTIPDSTYACDFDVEASSVRAEGLDCDRHAPDRIQIRPPDGDVRFVVGDVAL